MDLQHSSAGNNTNPGKSKSVGTPLANAGTGKKQYIPDSGDGAVPHLYLRELPSGHRVWVVMARPAGSTRPVVVTLGREASLKRKAARKLAYTANARLAEGINPNAEKKEKRAAERAASTAAKAATAHTLLAVGRAYIRRCQEGTRQRGPRSAATLAEYHRKLQSDLEPWHARPISGITAAEVQSLIDRIGKRAPIAANRLFELLSAIFNFAVSKAIIPASPLKSLAREELLYQEKSRERTLVHPLTGDLSELAALWRGVETIEPAHHPLRALAKILILTGARVGTFARSHPGQQDAILWKHVKDLDRPKFARIEVPAPLRKTGGDGGTFTIALSPAAVEVLDGLAKVGEDAPVFTMDGERPMRVDAEERNRLRDVANKAAGRELERFTIHDIRRSVATGLGHLGCPVPVQDAILDHAGDGKRGVRGTYNRAELFGPCKEWLTKWANSLTAAMEKKKKGGKKTK